jgi:methyltransferase (TIGR00027 family)
MIPGKTSRTAQHMALFRAIESFRSYDSRLFNDPFATLFLTPGFQFIVHLCRIPILSYAIPYIIDLIIPGARTSAIARTRFIDDLLCAALPEIAQVVILGAGYDCRPYRIPNLDQVSVFELDHPDTLEQKRQCLKMALCPIPQHVRFIATDFNQQSAGETLATTDHDPRLRTFFIWEGVTNYLSESAVDKMFCWLGTATPGSLIAFTYVNRRVLEEPKSFYGAKRLLRNLERLGEPWTFGLDPVEIPRYLSIRGLTLIEDVGANEYRLRYLKGRRDVLKGYEFYRVAFAQVSTGEDSGESAIRFPER